MKLILSSCDFINENSKKVILDNVEKDLSKCKVLFIPNEKATPEKIKSDKYYQRLKEDGFTNKKNIYIFDENKAEEFKNLKLDLIYVGGGNTFKTMDKLRKCNFLEVISNYIKNGVTYIGGSCGAHIVTKNIKHVEEFDQNDIELKEYNGLGFLDGIIIPHYDSTREKKYQKIAKESKYKIYTLTNDDSIVIVDNKINIIEKS